MPVILQNFDASFATLANRRDFLAFLGAGALISAAEPLLGQDPETANAVSPREFGIDIPPGTITPGGGRRVLTDDQEGKPVVAKLHVEVGDQRIALLPDGELVPRSAMAAPFTERPFVPIAKADLAKRLLVGKLAKHKTKESKRYLYLYNTSETFALATQKILESMFPGIAAFYEAQGLGNKSVELPLVVIMFKTEEEFQNFRRMPPGVMAYYNVVSNQVVLYEESKLAKLSPDLAIAQAISTIAHEGVHQILHNLGVQQRLSVWPMWLSEGLAEYFAPTTVGKGLAWKGADQINDFRMFELDAYLKSHSETAANGRLIADTVSSAKLTSSGYASAWALTLFLAKTEKAAFNRYVAEMSKLGPLEGNWQITGRGYIPANLTAFQKHFGGDLSDLETRLIKYLKRLPYDDPFAALPHFAALVASTVDGKPRRDASVFISNEKAEHWLRDTVASLPEDARGKAQSAVRQFANRTLAERAVNEFLRSR